MARRSKSDPLTVDTNAEYFIRTPDSSPNSTSSELSLKKDVLGFGALSDGNPSATVETADGAFMLSRTVKQTVNNDNSRASSSKDMSNMNNPHNLQSPGFENPPNPYQQYSQDIYSDQQVFAVQHGYQVSTPTRNRDGSQHNGPSPFHSIRQGSMHHGSTTPHVQETQCFVINNPQSTYLQNGGHHNNISHLQESSYPVPQVRPESSQNTQYPSSASNTSHAMTNGRQSANNQNKPSGQQSEIEQIVSTLLSQQDNNHDIGPSILMQIQQLLERNRRLQGSESAYQSAQEPMDDQSVHPSTSQRCETVTNRYAPGDTYQISQARNHHVAQQSMSSTAPEFDQSRQFHGTFSSNGEQQYMNNQNRSGYSINGFSHMETSYQRTTPSNGNNSVTQSTAVGMINTREGNRPLSQVSKPNGLTKQAMNTDRLYQQVFHNKNYKSSANAMNQPLFPTPAKKSRTAKPKPKQSDKTFAKPLNLPFACHMCDIKFADKFALHRHELVHEDNHTIMCKECGLFADTLTALYDHLDPKSGTCGYATVDVSTNQNAVETGSKVNEITKIPKRRGRPKKNTKKAKPNHVMMKQENTDGSSSVNMIQTAQMTPNNNERQNNQGVFIRNKIGYITQNTSKPNLPKPPTGTELNIHAPANVNETNQPDEQVCNDRGKPSTQIKDASKSVPDKISYNIEYTINYDDVPNGRLQKSKTNTPNVLSAVLPQAAAMTCMETQEFLAPCETLPFDDNDSNPEQATTSNEQHAHGELNKHEKVSENQRDADVKLQTEEQLNKDSDEAMKKNECEAKAVTKDVSSYDRHNGTGSQHTEDQQINTKDASITDKDRKTQAFKENVSIDDQTRPDKNQFLITSFFRVKRKGDGLHSQIKTKQKTCNENQANNVRKEKICSTIEKTITSEKRPIIKATNYTGETEADRSEHPRSPVVQGSDQSISDRMEHITNMESYDRNAAQIEPENNDQVNSFDINRGAPNQTISTFNPDMGPLYPEHGIKIDNVAQDIRNNDASTTENNQHIGKIDQSQQSIEAADTLDTSYSEPVLSSQPITRVDLDMDMQSQSQQLIQSQDMFQSQSPSEFQSQSQGSLQSRVKDIWRSQSQFMKQDQSQDAIPSQDSLQSQSREATEEYQSSQNYDIPQSLEEEQQPHATISLDDVNQQTILDPEKKSPHFDIRELSKTDDIEMNNDTQNTNNARMLVCTICSFNFKDKRSLDFHYKLRHPGKELPSTSSQLATNESTNASQPSLERQRSYKDGSQELEVESHEGANLKRSQSEQVGDHARSAHTQYDDSHQMTESQSQHHESLNLTLTESIHNSDNTQKDKTDNRFPGNSELIQKASMTNQDDMLEHSRENGTQNDGVDDNDVESNYSSDYHSDPADPDYESSVDIGPANGRDATDEPYDHPCCESADGFNDDSMNEHRLLHNSEEEPVKQDVIAREQRMSPAPTRAHPSRPSVTQDYEPDNGTQDIDKSITNAPIVSNKSRDREQISSRECSKTPKVNQASTYDKIHRSALDNKHLTPTENRQPDKYSTPKPLRCKYCTERFILPKALRSHQKIMHGDKPSTSVFDMKDQFMSWARDNSKSNHSKLAYDMNNVITSFMLRAEHTMRNRQTPLAERINHGNTNVGVRQTNGDGYHSDVHHTHRSNGTRATVHYAHTTNKRQGVYPHQHKSAFQAKDAYKEHRAYQGIDAHHHAQTSAQIAHHAQGAYNNSHDKTSSLDAIHSTTDASIAGTQMNMYTMRNMITNMIGNTTGNILGNTNASEPPPSKIPKRPRLDQDHEILETNDAIYRQIIRQKSENIPLNMKSPIDKALATGH